MKITLPNFAISNRVIGIISNLLPSNEVELQKIKDDIWADLTAIYYKYDDNAQKIAFREVTQEISHKLVEGKWDSIYKKLYKKDKATKNIHFQRNMKGI